MISWLLEAVHYVKVTPQHRPTPNIDANSVVGLSTKEPTIGSQTRCRWEGNKAGVTCMMLECGKK